MLSFYLKNYLDFGILHVIDLMQSSSLFMSRSDLPVIDIFILVSDIKVSNILNSLSLIESYYFPKYNFLFWFIISHDSLYNFASIKSLLLDFLKTHRGLLCINNTSFKDTFYLLNMNKFLKKIGEIHSSDYIFLSDINSFPIHDVNSKYSVLIDQDVYFELDAFKALIKSIKSSKYFILSTPLCVDDNNIPAYDNELSFSESNELLSCFNGVAIIRSYAFHKANWKYIKSNSFNIHKRFCFNLRSFGSLLINNNITVLKFS